LKRIATKLYKKQIKNMTQEQIFGVVRHGLSAIGGILIAKGLLDEGSWTELTGAAMTLVGVIWSIVSKKK
jgi:hypothetical protein